MNESNRRIASLNRIDELNQRIPKRPVDSLMSRQDRSRRAHELARAAQDPFKTARKPPKTFQRGLKSPQERPKTPQDGPRTTPRALLGRSWSHLRTNEWNKDRKQDRPGSISVFLLADLGPKMAPQMSQQLLQPYITLLSILDSSWTGLGAILAWLGAQKRDLCCFKLGFLNIDI